MNTIEEINKEWAKDIASFSESPDYMYENKRIPYLNHKYYTVLNNFVLKNIKLQNDLKVLSNYKFEYYTGSLPTQDLKELGWPPFQLKILKSEAQRYIDADKDIISINNKISYVLTTIKYLEEIIKQINGMNYLIKNHIELSKLQSGLI